MDRFQDDILPMLLTLLCVAAAVVVGLKLIWRRPLRGVGRVCNHCGYSTTGLGTKECPECGRDPASLRRVRWRWAAVGVLVLLVGGQLAMYKERRGEEWWVRLVPTTVWCIGERWWPAEEESWRSSLIGHRLENSHGWGWQVRLALGERFSLDAVEACVRTSERWPEGEPVMVRLNWSPVVWQRGMPHWCGVSLEATTTSVAGEAAAIYAQPSYISCGMSSGRRKETLVLAAAAPGSLEVAVRVKVSVDGTLVCDRIMRRVVKVEPRGTPILKPVIDDELTRRIVNRTSVEVDAGQWRIMPALFDDRTFVGVGMGVRVELIRDGKAVKLKDAVSLVETEAWRSPRLDEECWYTAFALPDEYVEQGAMADYAERRTPLSPGLRVRITGDEVASLRLLKGDTYWAGSVEMPLEEWAYRSKHQMDYLKAEKKP